MSKKDKLMHKASADAEKLWASEDAIVLRARKLIAHVDKYGLVGNKAGRKFQALKSAVHIYNKYLDITRENTVRITRLGEEADKTLSDINQIADV